MFKSTGELEQYLWDQVSDNIEIIGAVWIESGEIRAQALRNDFDLFVLEDFKHRSRSSSMFRPYSIPFEFRYLVAFRMGNNAILVLETIGDPTKHTDRRPADDQSPYISIGPDMGYGFA